MTDNLRTAIASRTVATLFAQMRAARHCELGRSKACPNCGGDQWHYDKGTGRGGAHLTCNGCHTEMLIAPVLGEVLGLAVTFNCWWN